MGSLLSMLALTALMIVEKTAPYGARLVAPLGGALVLAGVAVSMLALSADPGGLPEALRPTTGTRIPATSPCWWRRSAW